MRCVFAVYGKMSWFSRLTPKHLFQDTRVNFEERWTLRNEISTKKRIIDLLIRLRLFPGIFYCRLPFKIYEFRQIEQTSNFSNEDVVLDVGCGLGLQTLCIGRKCKEITGVDIDCASIDFAKHLSSALNNKIQSRFLCTSIEKASFPENSFDRVISLCVIEHISNYKEVLTEIHRVLKPRGSLVFSVDSLTSINSVELRTEHMRNHHVVEYFSKVGLRQLLEEIGFKEIEINPILKSDFAKRLFISGIRDGFKPRKAFVFDYARLVFSEKHTRNKDGLLLLAKCIK